MDTKLAQAVAAVFNALGESGAECSAWATSDGMVMVKWNAHETDCLKPADALELAHTIAEEI